MATLKLRNGFLLRDFGAPYFVAEINTSHFGSVNVAKDMILAAKEAGCNCVKFQSWSADTLYSQEYYNQNPIAKRFVEKFSFSESQLSAVSEFSRTSNIDFASTPYSKSEVQFLLDVCNVPYIKIASMDLNNYPYLDFIGRTGVPIVLSTGMSDIDEIREAIKVIESTGNRNICLLHCISVYPAEVSTIRLLNITGLREEFPSYPIGFSDHSIGIEMAIAAVALGACLIEKHLTLDKSRIGMDNQMATEPLEMKSLTESCRNVQVALGGSERVLSKIEIDQRKKMRRSVVAKKDLQKGHILGVDDFDLKRPGDGFEPGKISSLIGKVLLSEIKQDEQIKNIHIDYP